MAVTKRIFQLSKEFERDEKEIIAFLTAQGIKVSNRLSAVSEEAYNMLKAKFMAPPEPEPEPEPVVQEPAPVEVDEAPSQQPQPSGKKKKKNKSPQPAPQAQTLAPVPAKEQTTDAEPVKLVSDEKIANMSKRTQSAMFEGIVAGNEFIANYSTTSGRAVIGKGRKAIAQLSPTLDMWEVLYNHKFEYPDSSPARYWNSVAKLMTRAFKINNAFGLKNREAFAKIREATKSLGADYQPREIFTEEENQKFAEQQKLLYETFGHGAGLVNDNLYDLKLKAERMKVKYERMSFLEYVTNPQAELRSNERVPFNELAEAVTYALRGIARRFYFFNANEERINKIIKDFFEWIDGYAKLKEMGADEAKLEKYLALEEKFVNIVEFMSFDNLLDSKKDKPTPFDTIVNLLNDYRDNMDDPDAERNFKYKVRGVINVIYKPKEFTFIYRFADLAPNVDYRPPEMNADTKKENPADNTDEV